jgi:hypothetical protein
VVSRQEAAQPAAPQTETEGENRERERSPAMLTRHPLTGGRAAGRPLSKAYQGGTHPSDLFGDPERQPASFKPGELACHHTAAEDERDREETQQAASHYR